jgi:pSer/pThr/pTyr-binding forkhead associated (FHA) protein
VAFLKIVQGKRRGQVFELRGERTVIGRHPSCQIVLDGPAISRQHAQIFETYGRYFIEDMRSRNRTRLNGETVDSRTELADGDKVKICDITFEFSRKQPSLVDLIGGDSRPEVAAAAAVRSAGGSAGMATTGSHPPISLSRAMWDVPEEDDSAIITTINTRSTLEPAANVKADVKLRAVLEIGGT